MEQLFIPALFSQGPPLVNNVTPSSAGYGQTVTVTGNNLSGATAVTFGGTPASYTVMSPTTINAVVGAGSSGSVSVTTNYGTGSIARFTYLPIPIISSFTPTQGGQGTVINIEGSNFTGTTNVSFGGVMASSFTVVSPTSILLLPARAHPEM